MFKLDDNLLQELGLGSLPVEEKNKMLGHIYETLEMRVGMKLAEQMTNEQLDEFESYIEKDYENIWAMKPWQKFSREVFDKFLQRGKYERYSEELKDETLTLRDEVKRLLDGMKY